MATVSDAQRLIALSLGKIAASRSQRGGANLHRSLLVSHVLHKARTAFMMENFQAMLQAKKNQEKAMQSQGPSPLSTQTPVATTPKPEPQQQPAAGNKDSSPAEPTTPSPRLVAEPHAEENKENAPPARMECTTEITHSKPDTIELVKGQSEEKETSCSKSVKRRIVACDSDKEVVVGGSSPAKRSRSDSSLCESNTRDHVEPMQTESVQISNLVHRFNSGLSGLLGSSSAHSNTLTSCNNNSKNIASHEGHSENLVSCSTQVKETGFQDSLSRPVIALTV